MFRLLLTMLLFVCPLALALPGLPSSPAGVDSLVQKVTKFGSDSRQPLTDRSTPWGAIGRLTRPHMTCTATLVGPDLILTAGHCVVDAKTHKIITANYRFQPQYIRGRAPYSAGVTFITVGTLNSDETASDWALLKLNWKMGEKVGWVGVFGMSYEEIQQAQRKSATYMAGYSADYGRGEVLSWQRDCGIQGVEGNGYLLHNCSGTHGASGSPILTFINTKDARIIAINVAQRNGQIKVGNEGWVVAEGYSPDYANLAAPASNFIRRLKEMKGE